MANTSPNSFDTFLNRSLYEKLLTPAYNILRTIDFLNKQTPLGTTSFTNDQYGSITAARRSSKPFIIGIIPPDNPVNFVPVEDVKTDLLDYSSGGSVATQWTKEKVEKANKDGQLGPSNGSISEGDQISAQNLNTLTSSGFFSDLAGVASNLGVKPEDLLLVLYGQSGLASNEVQTGKLGSSKGISQVVNANQAGISNALWGNYGNASAVQQLPFVQQYLSNVMAKSRTKGPYTATQLYLMSSGGANYVGKAGTPSGAAGNITVFPPGSSTSFPGTGPGGAVTLADFQNRITQIQNDPAYKTAAAQLTNLNAATPRSLMAYSGVTDMESDDPTVDRLGKNIRPAKAERQRIAQQQTDALQGQINIIKLMPPLLLLINPSEFSRNYEQSVDSSPKTRLGHIVHVWLERPMKISGSGVSAGQYVIDVSGAGGLNTQNRVYSLSYQNLMSLAMIYRNNGVILAGSESQRGVPILSCSVYIYYDNHVYIGSFNDFQLDDAAGKPFNMAYTFSFDVRYDLDAINSRLIETQIRPGV